jgi:transposase
MEVGAVKHDSEKASVQAITTIGLDIAKSVFQVHCVDADGNVVLRRQFETSLLAGIFQRLPLCLLEIEVCVVTLLVT